METEVDDDEAIKSEEDLAGFILVRCTNIYIDKIKEKYQRDRHADLVEMRAFLGMLFAMGVSRNGRRNLRFLG